MNGRSVKKAVHDTRYHIIVQGIIFVTSLVLLGISWGLVTPATMGLLGVVLFYFLQPKRKPLPSDDGMYSMQARILAAGLDGRRAGIAKPLIEKIDYFYDEAGYQDTYGYHDDEITKAIKKRIDLIRILSREQITEDNDRHLSDESDIIQAGMHGIVMLPPVVTESNQKQTKAEIYREYVKKERAKRNV